MATERGQYRFSVKETARGTFFLAAEPAGDELKGLKGLLLAFDLAEGVTLAQAMTVAGVMNQRIMSISFTTLSGKAGSL